MISLIIAIIIGMSFYTVCFRAMELNAFWSVTFGILAFFVTQLSLGFFFRKKVNAVTNEIQRVLMEAQEKLNRKLSNFQQRPVGSVQQMQKMLEKEQKESLKQAVRLTDQLEPYYLWSLFLKKQVATMRMQFYYQMGDLEKVDELMPEVMLMDPMAVGMKMARQYKNGDSLENIEKTFRSKIKKFKGDNGTLLYSLFTWILLKKDKKEKALEVISEGKDNTENEIIIKNWEMLANNKFKSFSNAPLGDQWYSLRLETMKAPKQKTQRRFR